MQEQLQTLTLEEARKKEWQLSDREREIVERLNHAPLTLDHEPKTE